jgi:hypothetical protein
MAYVTDSAHACGPVTLAANLADALKTKAAQPGELHVHLGRRCGGSALVGCLVRCHHVAEPRLRCQGLAAEEGMLQRLPRIAMAGLRPRQCAQQQVFERTTAAVLRCCLAAAGCSAQCAAAGPKLRLHRLAARQARRRRHARARLA